MKVVVTGSREFKDDFRASLLIHEVVISLRAEGYDHLIHGKARGADSIAAAAAERIGMRVTAVPADWEAHGKRAGILRNILMLEEWEPDVVVAFWNGNSPGTRHMIETSKKRDLPVRVWLLS